MDIKRGWPTEEEAMAHLEHVLWDGRPLCPYCRSERVSVHTGKDRSLPRRQCQDCHITFSATVRTIFHGTHLALPVWYQAIWLMTKAKKPISTTQVARDLYIPYKTAWKLVRRIRKAMADPNQHRLIHSIVEMVQTHVGDRGRGTDRMTVFDIVARNIEAKAKGSEKYTLIIPNLNKSTSG